MTYLICGRTYVRSSYEESLTLLSADDKKRTTKLQNIILRVHSNSIHLFFSLVDIHAILDYFYLWWCCGYQVLLISLSLVQLVDPFLILGWCPFFLSSRYLNIPLQSLVPPLILLSLCSHPYMILTVLVWIGSWLSCVPLCGLFCLWHGITVTVLSSLYTSACSIVSHQSLRIHFWALHTTFVFNSFVACDAWYQAWNSISCHLYW